MNRRRVWWVQRPDQTDDDGEQIPDSKTDYEHLRVRLVDEWYSINSRDQLILPVQPLYRLTDQVVPMDDNDPGLLVQYGGAELALDLLEAGPSQGTEWIVAYDPRYGFVIDHVSDWTAPFPWVEAAIEDAE